jgi:hypothetical protein
MRNYALAENPRCPASRCDPLKLATSKIKYRADDHKFAGRVVPTSRTEGAQERRPKGPEFERHGLCSG